MTSHPMASPQWAPDVSEQLHRQPKRCSHIPGPAEPAPRQHGPGAGCKAALEEHAGTSLLVPLPPCCLGWSKEHLFPSPGPHSKSLPEQTKRQAAACFFWQILIAPVQPPAPSSLQCSLESLSHLLQRFTPGLTCSLPSRAKPR